jgi:hypothetical protein
MATTYTVSRVSAFGEDAHVISWTLENGETGQALEMSGSINRTIQFSGTFGVGGTVVMQGSNDGTNYVTLTDPQGNAISKTAAAIEAIEEPTRYIRPSVTAGDGTTSLTCSLFLRRT